ncbi:MAG: DUF167 domain-containing protein [Bryobacterales bacterium]|nr:DUF167 domain-containing protein [Bryobacterales bacterium]
MSARISIKVHPRAKRAGCGGKLGDAFKINVSAPAEGGRANEACTAYLGELFGVPQAAVRIRTGLTKRLKVIEIDGITQAAAEEKLNK